MTYLKDMPIGMRLFVLVGFMSLLLVGIGLMGLSGMIASKDGLSTVYKNSVLRVQQLRVLIDLYGVKVIKTANRIGDGGLAWSEGRSDIDDARKAIPKNWEAYLAADLLPEEKKLVVEAQPMIGAAERSIGELRGLLENKEDYAALAAHTTLQLYPAIDPILGKLSELIDVQMGVAKQEYEKAQFRSKVIRNIAVSGMGGGVFLSVLFSVFIIRSITRPLNAAVGVAVKIADGDFTQNVDVRSRDEVGVLGEAFDTMSKNLSRMIKQTQEVADNVAQISGQIKTGSKQMHDGAQVQASSAENAASSVEEMNASIKQIAESIEILSSSAEETSSSILEMSSSIDQVAHIAGGLATSVDDTSSSIVQMSSSIKQVAENVTTLSSDAEETASAIHEINSTVREVETHAKESAALSEQVTKDAQELGVQSIDKTIAGMKDIQDAVVKSADVINRLGERSEQIGNVLTVIDEVTKQTNLLALNAAILAAQAGEQGKGFAVVAEEIKSLANRTGASTNEITQLISTVQAEVKDAVKSVHNGAKRVEEGMRLSLEAGEALKKILDTSTRSTRMAREIERATVEQTRGIHQVTEVVQRINTMARQISKATQEQRRGSEQIMQAAEKMRDMTRQVKISTEEQAKGSRQITKAGENVTERVQQIARAINEQRRGSEIIMGSVEAGRKISRQSVKLVTEMNQMVEELAKQAELLKRSIGRFQVRQ